MRLKATPARTIVRPENVEIHHADRRYGWPSATIAPHSGVGGATPRPRYERPARVRMFRTMSAIEKTLRDSDLGVNPSNDGNVIRCVLPALTEERRKELTKLVHSESENAKVAIRNIRRDANHQVKELLKEKQVTEDEVSRSEIEIQKITDSAIKDVDEVVKAKEQELMAV